MQKKTTQFQLTAQDLFGVMTIVDNDDRRYHVN